MLFNAKRRFLLKLIICLPFIESIFNKSTLAVAKQSFDRNDTFLNEKSDLADGLGRRVYRQEENISLLHEILSEFNISRLIYDNDNFSIVKNAKKLDFLVSTVVSDGTTLLLNKLKEAKDKNATLYIHGGGDIYVDEEIYVNVNIVGDGLTRIIQRSKYKSLLVISLDEIFIQNLILTPSSFNNSINQSAVEIRKVNHCGVLNVNIHYNGSKTEEGNGISINEGSYNVILGNKITGADLNDGIFHPLGGNDISVYGNSSFNVVAFNYSFGRNIRGIFQLNDILGKKCDHNVYLCNTSIGNIGYGHICYEKKHDKNTSMRNTLFLRGEVRNVSGGVVIPDGKYANKKVFGMGVYNQGGQDTIIADYLIENVMTDPEIEVLLPTGAIGSTGANISIIRNTIVKSGKSGIKISNIYKNKNSITLLSGNKITLCSDEAVYLLSCDNVFITGMFVSGCNGVVKAVNKSRVPTFYFKLSVINLYSQHSFGSFIDGYNRLEFKKIVSINDENVLRVANIDKVMIDNLKIYNGKGYSLYLEDSCEGGVVSHVTTVDTEGEIKVPGKVSFVYGNASNVR